MIGPVIARAALVAAAAAAAVWLGVGLHSTRLTAKAERLAARPPQVLTPREVDRVEDLFERARRRNPDLTPTIEEGAFLVRSGRPKRGLELIEEAVRREPSNPLGWAVLVYAAAPHDPGRSLEARARLRELRPPVRPTR